PGETVDPSRSLRLVTVAGRIARSTSSTVEVFDGDSGASLHETTMRGHIEDIAWSPDGTTLAIGRRDGRVVLWDVARDTTTKPWRLTPDGWAAQVALSPDNTRL